MENLLAPLEELTKKELPEEIAQDKISIPSTDYLMKQHKLIEKSDNPKDKKMTKYEKEYEEFCRWSGLPKDERNPKTAVEWERQHLLPKGYTNYFKGREDYRDKTLEFFWEWMMDVLPDVVYSVYKRARTKSAKDAGLFIDLIGKRMNLDKPRSVIQPLMLVGVDQDKIDALFTPKGYENVKEIIPGEK